jgi:hypothetical protein
LPSHRSAVLETSLRTELKAESSKLARQQVSCFVSGHDFSRAGEGQKKVGL